MQSNMEINSQPNNFMTQQSFMNNPKNTEIQNLLMQQQSIQDQLTKYQTNMASKQAYTMANVNHNDPQTSTLEQQFNAPQINIDTKPQEAKPFNPPPQTNIKYYSEDNTANSILQNQFGAITDTNNTSNSTTISMEPDSNIDYTSILKNLNNETNAGINNQFNTDIQNLAESKETKVSQVEKIFPTSTFSDEKRATNENSLTIKNVESENLELEIIKKNISLQSKNIDDTNSKLQQLITAIEKQDISKFYETILDIPRLIEQQKTQPLTIRTHNLIVSSRDRDLANLEFDKYNFRIVFGAQGTETIQDIKYNETGTLGDAGDSNMGKYETQTKTYVSSGMKNPTVQQVLKNVISIKLKRVILPKPRDGTTNYFPEPYYFVGVDEFNSNIISTKTFNDKLFCKIHFDKEFAFGDRKYMYYKNDDDDYTLFYSSPLGKLDRLTLKLLGSDGTSVKELFGDSDIYQNTDGNDPNFTSSEEFFNGTFVKDNLYNTTTTQSARVTSIDINSLSTTIASDISTADGQHLVNLNNQIEYVFEIKTQEPDPTNQVRPIISS